MLLRMGLVCFYGFDCIFSICRGQALAVAPEGRRKAVPLPRIIEKIPLIQSKRHPIARLWHQDLSAEVLCGQRAIGKRGLFTGVFSVYQRQGMNAGPVR